MPFKIEHDRPGCIACAACAAVAPEFWEMSKDDGKSDVIGSKQTTNGNEVVLEELDLEDKDYELNKSAADVCPVNVIHIVNKETGEKVI